MHRRAFLRNSSVMLSSPLLPTGAVLAEAAAPPPAIRIFEEFIDDDYWAVDALRKAILEGQYRFVDLRQREWLAQYYGSPHDLPAENSAWVLWAENGENRWLLRYEGSNVAFPGARRGGFMAWLNDFKPRNCNDWLMVPSLYARHVFDIDAIDWRIGPTFTHSDSLDLILSSTRGLLYWWWQVEQFLAEVLCTSRIQARKIWLNYLCQESETIRLFQDTNYDESTLLTIARDRTLNGQYFKGWPMWHVAGFLSQHIRYHWS